MVALLSAAIAGGCASLVPRNGLPEGAIVEKAVVADNPGVRYFADHVPHDLAEEMRRRLPSLTRLSTSGTTADGRPIVDILALSGGGSDGAFGAGLLAGWSARGDRPKFDVVTGVSAGAIIAPFAFLGSGYDKELREIWTQYETSELVVSKIVPGLLGGPALSDTAPLRALIEKYVDRRLLSGIAREYGRGRILLIGTTNLDAQRPVVWNMGEIALRASRGDKSAAALFRDVILASAAIPGAFPPVSVKVEVDGKSYEEMHVDGGVMREVFVSPVEVPYAAFDRFYGSAKKPLRRIFVVKNGKLVPEYTVVPAKAVSIAARSIATLIKAQHRADIYRIYRLSRDDSAEFRLAAVPPAFNVKAKEAFDPAYLEALFEEGFKFGRIGTGWMRAPPELAVTRGPH
ncbi:MAG TPA: patatin-like phospholipase family protein [Hyphomicrobiaceae bacterium]|nr:patatin-like phospholipase family protein [Hyphomicrobiaceae bacterium]